jgi:hypothetical protein
VSVKIARCPEHGLHGERDTCFVCGGPVEQVDVIPAEELWVPFGYTAAESRELERTVAELVARGSAKEPHIARRAIAAITWQPALEAMQKAGIVELGLGS